MSRRPWFLRGRWKYVAAVALAADLGLGAFSTAMAVTAGASPAAQASTLTSSAKTISWTDDRHALDSDWVDPTTPDPADDNQALFKDLQVTVAQTQDLTDQGLLVTWQGGKATSAGGAANNFLQLMQCWGSKGASGPTPQQCQWGTPTATLASQVGTATATRDLMVDDEADPKQSLGPEVTHAQFGQPANKTIPFWSVDDPGRKSLGWTNDAYHRPPFDQAQSNEMTYARTAANGTGQAIFNLQSSLSSPYLGCGNPTYKAAGDTCWLVVVPRGEYNLNNAKASEHADNDTYVSGSPLSASAWQDRIQFKLDFSPVGAGCSIGASEAQSAGTELAASALSSWQPALCARGARVGYSEIGDGEARTTVGAGAGGPALGFVYSPIDPDTAAGQTLVYAPVATSSIVVSYLIDKNYTSAAANPDLGANGTLVTNLRLTPRLVAKLLTQSYKVDVAGEGNGTGTVLPSTNPTSLRTDPEFQALNPDFTYFYDGDDPDGLIVPFGDSDAARAVWAWLRSDPDALAFLKGGADPWGMRINPSYKALDLATDLTISSFPKADPAQFRAGDAPAPGYGTIDLRPFAADFTDGGERTIAANNGQKTFWDIAKTPPQYTAKGPQPPGHRFELALTTSQAAALYGAPVASFVTDVRPNNVPTSPGVAPTAAAMAKEMAAARTSTSVANVSAIDPDKSPVDGYPLTLPTYAVVNVCAADLSDLKTFAKFLDYAAGPGQVSGTKPGQLPLGYAPLSAADRAHATSAASALRAEIKKPRCASHKKPSSGPATVTPPSATPSVTPSTPVVPPAAPVVPPVSAPAAPAPPAVTPPPTVDAPPGGITPAAFVTPAGRYALLAALCFALPCLIGGPGLLAATRRRRS